MATSDSINLLFRATGKTDEAKAAFKDLEQSIGGTTGSAAALGSALSTTAVAVAAVAAVVTTVATGLYNLTKASADYAGAIFDVQEKTGLTAATLSTLKINADNAGSSLEAVGNSTAKFARLLGEASAGNEKAKQTLRDLGVTSTELDKALSQAAKTIYDAEKGTQQLVLAQKAFGKSGGDMLPVIKQLGGDIEAATKQAEYFGTTLTEKDLVAADNFGDALGLLSSQAQTAAVAFTSDLMPVLTDFFTSTSEWYARNKDQIRDWGTEVADIVRGIASYWRDATNAISSYMAESRAFGKSPFNTGVSDVPLSMWVLGAGGTALLQRGAQERMNQPLRAGLGGAVGSGAFGARTSSGKGKGNGTSDSGAKAAAQLKADLQAQVGYQQLVLRQLREEYNKTLEKIRDDFAKTGDSTSFAKAANSANKKYTDDAQIALDEIHRLSEARARVDNESAAQRKLRLAQQKQEVDALNDYKLDAQKANAKLIEGSEKELTDKILKMVKTTIAEREQFEREAIESWRAREVERYEAQIASGNNQMEAIRDLTAFLREQYESDLANAIVRIDAERDRRRSDIEDSILEEHAKADALREINDAADAEKVAARERLNSRLSDIDRKYMIEIKAELTPFEAAVQDFLGKITSFLLVTDEKTGQLSVSFSKLFSSIAGMGLEAFGALASGFGQMMASWVLYGDQGGNSMRKLFATVLAQVAQVATTYAILCLGMAALASTGFGALFTQGTPAQFLAAAAILGGVALAAGLTGRAVAGNSFRSQTGSGAISSTASRSRGSGGSVFSSQEDGVVETSRNDPGGRGISIPPIGVQLHLKLDSKGVLEVVKSSIRNNGDLRGVIIDAVS